MLLSVDDDASPILGSSSIGLANNSTFGDGLVNNNGTPSSSSPSNNSHHHYHHQLNLSMPVANGHGNMRLKLHNGRTSNQQQTPNNGYQHLYQQQQHHQTIAKVPSSKSTQLHKLCDIPGCTKYASRSRLKRQMILNAPIIEEEDKIRLLEAQEKLYICGSHNWQLKGKGKKQSGGGGGGGASGNGKASSSTSHYFNNAGSSQNDIDSVFNDFEEDSQLDRDEINDQDDSNNNGGGSMCEGLEDQDEIVDNFDVEKMRCQYDQQSNAVQESFDMYGGSTMITAPPHSSSLPITTTENDAPQSNNPCSSSPLSSSSSSNNNAAAANTEAAQAARSLATQARTLGGIYQNPALSQLLQQSQVQTLLQSQQLLLQQFLQQQHMQLLQLLHQVQQQQSASSNVAEPCTSSYSTQQQHAAAQIHEQPYLPHEHPRHQHTDFHQQQEQGIGNNVDL